MQKIKGSDFTLCIPEYFNEAPWEAKGYFVGAVLECQKRRYELTFYDSVRLSQDVCEDLESEGLFCLKNLVVVKKIEKHHLFNACEQLIKSKKLAFFVFEEV